MKRSITLGQGFVVFAILASLWLLNHPYSGIWHDNILYTLMALNKLYPDIFAGDLFLKFGSQDNYTIFSPIYAGFIKAFGVYKSTLILTICGQLLWLFAAVSLFKIFVKGKSLWIALAILFFERGFYGGFNLVRYAEPFLTPRIFSEALCILGIASILKARYISSALLFFVSFIVHPIMTLFAVSIVYVYYMLVYPPIILSAPILFATIFILTLLKIEPFSGLSRAISPEWYQLLKIKTFHIFPTQWPIENWARLFFSLSIVAAACKFSIQNLRRIFLSTIIVSLCCLSVNIIGGELLKIEFIMQIQAWRCLWFLQFISALGAGVLIINFLRMRENGLLLCSFFMLSWYSLSLGALSFGFTMIFFYLSMRAAKNDLPSFKLARTMVFLIIILIIIIVVPQIISLIWGGFIKNDFNITLLSQLAEFALFYLFLPLVLSMVIFFFYEHSEKKPTLKIVVLSIALLIFSLAVWDRQSPWNKMLESNQDNEAFFKNILPKESTILWDFSPEIAWIGARRQGYISCHSGSGIVFYPKTAFEFAKRVKFVLPLLEENPLMPKIIQLPNWQADNTKFESNFEKVCRDADGLDYIISTVNVKGRPIAHWRAPVPMKKTRFLEDGTFEETTYQDFYLYDCRECRVEAKPGQQGN